MRSTSSTEGEEEVALEIWRSRVSGTRDLGVRPRFRLLSTMSGISCDELIESYRVEACRYSSIKERKYPMRRWWYGGDWRGEEEEIAVLMLLQGSKAGKV